MPLQGGPCAVGSSCWWAPFQASMGHAVLWLLTGAVLGPALQFLACTASQHGTSSDFGGTRIGDPLPRWRNPRVEQETRNPCGKRVQEWRARQDSNLRPPDSYPCLRLTAVFWAVLEMALSCPDQSGFFLYPVAWQAPVALARQHHTRLCLSGTRKAKRGSGFHVLGVSPVSWTADQHGYEARGWSRITASSHLRSNWFGESMSRDEWARVGL